MMALTGTIDNVGYLRPAAGWFISGTIGIGPDLAAGLPLGHFRGQIDGAPPSLKACIVLFERAGPPGNRVGFLLYLSRNGGPGEAPQQMTLWFGRQECQLGATAKTLILSGVRLLDHCNQLLDTAFAGQTGELAAMLRQPEFTDTSTIEALDELIRAGFDEVVLCGTGAILIGWLLAAPGTVRSLSLCWGDHRVAIQPGNRIGMQRPDVLENGGRKLGFDDTQCGFLAYVSEAQIGSARPYLMVETRSGQVGYTKAPQARQGGMAMVKRILGGLDLSHGGIRQAFDDILGPPLRWLNQERLQGRHGYSTVDYGVLPPAPRCSMIVPLFGRVDYLEYQMALISADPAALSWDIIYVLDDPPRRQESLELAHSVYARFGVPFRLILLADNLGYAPANNVGLGIARGKFVCFLNSDVFPGTPDFLNRLASTLQADRSLGAVGAVLLFEDGSVQHEGMTLRSLPAQDGLAFPIHLRKGRRPRPGLGVERCEAITGACMMLRRSEALELGGFDEAYMLGDFEDCDLCNRLLALGKSVAVDHRVRLYHLERQSQASPDVVWRRNLTLYNAWLYNTKRFAKAPVQQSTH